MGVHGLTTFIAKYHEKYKEKIYLHDCPIVIDGCNLMFFLYFQERKTFPSSSTSSNTPNKGKRSSMSPLSKPSPMKSPHLFGGDYITYAQNVREFFQHLKLCNISPIVLFDGAYDDLKIKTAFKRFAQNLKDNVRGSGSQQENKFKGITPGSSYSPVFMKAVFVEILQEQKILQYQTEHEADCTIAFIARKLGNCAILSSDSDFHMYLNAIVLPLHTLQFKKVAPTKFKGQVQPGSLPSTPDKSTSLAQSDKIWTLHSQFVSLRNLCQKQFGLSDPRLLPLTAVILGNDWITTSTFGRFHSTTAGGNHVNRYTRIAYLLKWLGKQKSYPKVLHMMLTSVRESRRESVEKLVKEIIQIYEGLGGEEYVWKLILESGKIDEFIKEESSPSAQIEETIEDLLDNLSINDTVVQELDVSLNNDSITVEDTNNETDIEEVDEDSDSDELNISKIEAQKPDKIKLPGWYLESHVKCWFPTYLLKLIKNRMVFLSPQAEISFLTSSHTMSIPIIQTLGGILLGEGQTLTLVSRQKCQFNQIEVETIAKLNNYGVLPVFDENCLNFRKALSLEERSQIILETLGLYEPSLVEFINEWPMSLRIWIIVLLYFIRKSKKECKEESFVEVRKVAIPVAIGILFSVIKNAVLNPSGESSNKDKSGETPKISDLLLQSDPIRLSKLRKFYAKEEIMVDVSSRGFTRFYDICRVYNLSQFTCILFHLNQLNRLLGDPFRAPRLSYNINNWFVYKFSGEIISKVSEDGNPEEEYDYGKFTGGPDVEDIWTIVNRILKLC